MKTNSEVEPALINACGKPVGVIRPVNISYCIINFLQTALMLFYDTAKAIVYPHPQY